MPAMGVGHHAVVNEAAQIIGDLIECLIAALQLSELAIADAGRNPPAHWFTTLRDAPRQGLVRPEIVALAEECA